MRLGFMDFEIVFSQQTITIIPYKAWALPVSSEINSSNLMKIFALMISPC